MMIRDYDMRAVSLRMHHLKIREYGDDDRKQLIVKLYSISRKIGVTKPPSATEDMPGIVEFLCNQYGEMTGDEFSYAFELSAACKFAKPLEHYNSFNIRMLGEVLQQYRHWHSQQMKAYRAEQDRLREAELERQKPGDPTVDECEAIYNRVANYAKKNGFLPPVDLWDKAFWYAEYRNFISIPVDKKQQILETCLAHVTREQLVERTRAKAAKRESNESTISLHMQAKSLARKRMLCKYFSQLFQTDITEWKDQPTKAEQ